MQTTHDECLIDDVPELAYTMPDPHSQTWESAIALAIAVAWGE